MIRHAIHNANPVVVHRDEWTTVASLRFFTTGSALALRASADAEAVNIAVFLDGVQIAPSNQMHYQRGTYAFPTGAGFRASGWHIVPDIAAGHHEVTLRAGVGFGHGSVYQSMIEVQSEDKDDATAAVLVGRRSEWP